MLHSSPLRLAALWIVIVGMGSMGDADASQASLAGVYNEAVQNDADLAAAKANYLARREVVPQAQAGLLPNLSGQATVGNTRTAFDEPPVTSGRSGNTYQLTLAQPLFHADRLFRIGAAEAENEQAVVQLADVQQNLVMRTAEGYFGVLRAQDNLAALTAEEKAFKSQLDQANARFSAGLADRTDTLEAQASFDTAHANRIVAARRVDDAYGALYTLTSYEHTSLQGVRHDLPLNPPSPADAGAWVDSAIKQNLSLAASNYAVESATAAVKQRKAEHAPTLDVVARLEKGDNDSLGFVNPSKTGARYGGDVEQRTIALQLNVPIYSGGTISSQVRASVAQLDESEHRREGVRRQVTESARDLYRAVITDVEQVKALNQSIISNQTAVQATEIGYKIGTRNIVDVLAAQRRLFSSVRDYNDSRYDFLLNSLQLKRTVGTLAPSDLLALQPYFNSDYNPDEDFLPKDISCQTGEGSDSAISAHGQH